MAQQVLGEAPEGPPCKLTASELLFILHWGFRGWWGGPDQPGRSPPSMGRAYHSFHVPSLQGWPRPRETPDTPMLSWSRQMREEEAEKGRDGGWAGRGL